MQFSILYQTKSLLHSFISDSSSVIFMNAAQLLKNEPKKFNLLIENVQDFHIKKDFMFVTRKVPNNTQLFISHRRGAFVKADFQTELEIKVINGSNSYRT